MPDTIVQQADLNSAFANAAISYVGHLEQLKARLAELQADYDNPRVPGQNDLLRGKIDRLEGDIAHYVALLKNARDGFMWVDHTRALDERADPPFPGFEDLKSRAIASNRARYAPHGSRRTPNTPEGSPWTP